MPRPVACSFQKKYIKLHKSHLPAYSMLSNTEGWPLPVAPNMLQWWRWQIRPARRHNPAWGFSVCFVDLLPRQQVQHSEQASQLLKHLKKLEEVRRLFGLLPSPRVLLSSVQRKRILSVAFGQQDMFSPTITLWLIAVEMKETACAIKPTVKRNIAPHSPQALQSNWLNLPFRGLIGALDSVKMFRHHCHSRFPRCSKIFLKDS